MGIPIVVHTRDTPKRPHPIETPWADGQGQSHLDPPRKPHALWDVVVHAVTVRGACLCAQDTHASVCVCMCVHARVCVHVCFTFLARIYSGNLSRKERVNVAIIRDKLIPDM